MKKQKSRSLVQVVKVLLLLTATASAILSIGCSQKTDSLLPDNRQPFRELAGVKLLMNSTIDPQSDLLWDSVGFIITADGEEEIRPVTDEEWTAVRNAAVILGESGNLLMMERRAMDQGQWMEFSSKLIDTSEEALKASDSRDTEALFEAGGHIYEVCLSCHETYIQSDDYAAPEGPVDITSTTQDSKSTTAGS